MLLRKDDPWLKDLPVPDIRNWRVLDADGRTVGFVQSVVVDHNEMKFEAILTGASDRYPSGQVELEEGVVRVNRTLEKRSKTRQPDDEGEPGGFANAFRDHFEREFAPRDLSFEELQPAYRFGRIMAVDADYSGRSFARAEEDLRGAYVARRLRPPFATVREAVRYGYELAQNLDRHPKTGMERDEKQIVGKEDASASISARAGSSMDTGSPAGEDESAIGTD